MRNLPLVCLPLLVGSTFAQSATFAVQTTPPLGGSAVYDPGRGEVLVFEATRTWTFDGGTFRLQLGASPPSTSGRSYPVLAPELGGIGFADGPLWNGARWQQLAVPTGWILGAGAYDAHRRRVVRLFASGTLDVAEWDGGQWLRITPPASPGIGQLTYDAQRGCCVLATGNPVSLWTWNGFEWTQLGPVGPAMTLRSFACDPAGGALVVLGTQGTAVGATFANGAWSPLAMPATLVANAALVPDGQGLLRLGTPTEGIWRLANGTWQPLPFDQPAARTGPALAGGPVGQGVLHFGGYSGNTLFGDTWRWDGAWTRYTPAHTPTARRSAGLAWSPVDQGFLLFGGIDASGTQNDTWLWNGTDWVVKNPATVPTAALRLVTDPTGRVLGLRSVATANTNDQWRWDGLDWHLEPSFVAAYAGATVVPAYDPHRNVVAAVVTYELWEWDGAVWTSRGNAADVPSAMTYRPDTQRLFAVTYSAGIEWDGAAWTSTVTSAALNGYAAIATDLRAGRVFALNDSHQPALLTSTPANATRSGFGCARGPAPGLLAEGRPRLGAAGFGLAATTFAAGAPTALALGFQSAPQHFGSGCVAWLSQPPAVHLLIADTAGRVRLPLPIPATPALAGVVVLGQAVVLDPARGLFSDLTFSELLQFVLGD